MDTDTETFYREVDQKHLVPLWNVTGELLPREPRTPVRAHLWRWADLRRLAFRAGDLVPIERGGERRVLGLVNPGLGGKPAATRTLWAAVQIVKPGEVAPCHRHSPSAIRFIIEGDRTYTNVNGDKCVMGRGDLVLTPSWDWHDRRAVPGETEPGPFPFDLRHPPLRRGLRHDPHPQADQVHELPLPGLRPVADAASFQRRDESVPAGPRVQFPGAAADRGGLPLALGQRFHEGRAAGHVVGERRPLGSVQLEGRRFDADERRGHAHSSPNKATPTSPAPQGACGTAPASSHPEPRPQLKAAELAEPRPAQGV